jgi:hypothetical protein
MSKNKRRLVPVPDDLYLDVEKASMKESASTRKFVEESLRQTVKMNELGYNAKQFVELCEVMQTYRVLGGTFVPMDVLGFLSSKAYKEDKETFQTKWYESGVWYGKFLKQKFEDPVQAFKQLLTATRWELSEVEATRDGPTVKIRCISNVLSNEETELLVKFIEGVMNGMGFQSEKLDYLKGIVALEYKQIQPKD